MYYFILFNNLLCLPYFVEVCNEKLNKMKKFNFAGYYLKLILCRTKIIKMKPFVNWVISCVHGYSPFNVENNCLFWEIGHQKGLGWGWRFHLLCGMGVAIGDHRNGRSQQFATFLCTCRKEENNVMFQISKCFGLLNLDNINLANLKVFVHYLFCLPLLCWYASSVFLLQYAACV